MLNANVSNFMVVGGILVGILGLMIGVLPLLKKKNINVDGILSNADKALTVAKPVIGAAKEILPNNPIVNIVDFIEKRAEKAVKNAEQLSNSSQLDAESRKQVATDTVYAALQEVGVIPTDNQKKLIDASIQAAVYDLPHTPVDIKQLQATNTDIQKANTQLQQQNQQLQQTLTNIQTAIAQ